MILMNDIVRDGHPSLRTKTEDLIFPLSQEDIILANDLLEYVINSQDDEMVEKYKIRPGIGIVASTGKC